MSASAAAAVLLASTSRIRHCGQFLKEEASRADDSEPCSAATRSTESKRHLAAEGDVIAALQERGLSFLQRATVQQRPVHAAVDEKIVPSLPQHVAVAPGNLSQRIFNRPVDLRRQGAQRGGLLLKNEHPAGLRALNHLQHAATTNEIEHRGGDDPDDDEANEPPEFPEPDIHDPSLLVDQGLDAIEIRILRRVLASLPDSPLCAVEGSRAPVRFASNTALSALAIAASERCRLASLSSVSRSAPYRRRLSYPGSTESRRSD